MLKHCMEIVHNHDNGYVNYLAMAKDLHLRNYLEVHSLSSDQVFFYTQK